MSLGITEQKLSSECWQGGAQLPALGDTAGWLAATA